MADKEIKTYNMDNGRYTLQSFLHVKIINGRSILQMVKTGMGGLWNLKTNYNLHRKKR